MERGRGAPSQDGDLTAESIIGAAIPTRRSAGRIPNTLGPLLRRVRRPALRAGIDGKATAARPPTRPSMVFGQPFGGGGMSCMPKGAALPGIDNNPTTATRQCVHPLHPSTPPEPPP